MQDNKFRISAKTQVNTDTATFTFTSLLGGQVINNLKSWYNDPAMIGRHFLVYAEKNPRVKRQYTICSSMNLEVQRELMRLANSIILKTDINFDYAMMLGQDQDSIDLTVKSYRVPKGLATNIHKTVHGLKDVTAIAALENEEKTHFEIDE